MLEAIIASGIIVTAVSSALTLVTSSIRASKDSETSIAAANLAREGIEVARAIRDSNWLEGQPFDQGLHDGTDYSAVAVFDPAANGWSLQYAPAAAVTDANAVVYRRVTADANAVAGLFQQAAVQPAGTVPTIYRRLVRTEPICDDGAVAAEGSACAGTNIGVRVTAEIRWSSGGGRIRTLAAEERMMDWR